MKTLILASSLVVVFALGLQHKEPKTDYVFKDRTDWKAWKSKHPNLKPWELTKK